ncbi:hypothetical protein GCK72_013517 [Caenorhabditis remanei]|uniref:Uncharacterized protein n=1 Tax=Caenorhabditis remanei TaxID=31234 RepID=A0A6A5GRS7_CAERE|nr:hypothetical protein GCK72_013517 [Caenorhabditis remanei]KAF1757062.1 hypothetical protein GCK72_013517 [Caenorhabditis remanei]
MLEVPDGSIVRKESVRFGPSTRPILLQTSTCSNVLVVEFASLDVLKSAIWVIDSQVARRVALPISAILDLFPRPF